MALDPSKKLWFECSCSPLFFVSHFVRLLTWAKGSLIFKGRNSTSLSLCLTADSVLMYWLQEIFMYRLDATCCSELSTFVFKLSHIYAKAANEGLRILVYCFAIIYAKCLTTPVPSSASILQPRHDTNAIISIFKYSLQEVATSRLCCSISLWLITQVVYRFGNCCLAFSFPFSIVCSKLRMRRGSPALRLCSGPACWSLESCDSVSFQLVKCHLNIGAQNLLKYLQFAFTYAFSSGLGPGLAWQLLHKLTNLT